MTSWGWAGINESKIWPACFLDVSSCNEKNQELKPRTVKYSESSSTTVWLPNAKTLPLLWFTEAIHILDLQGHHSGSLILFFFCHLGTAFKFYQNSVFCIIYKQTHLYQILSYLIYSHWEMQRITRQHVHLEFIFCPLLKAVKFSN